MIADPSLATRENLEEVREEESRASYRAIGVKPEQHFLRYPDGGLKDIDPEPIVEKITEPLEAFRPDVVVTFGPEGVTKHDDHVYVSRVGTDAFHRGRQLWPVRVCAVFDAVIEDDAVVVVGNLGLVSELDRLVDASFADRPGVGVVQADQAGCAFWRLPG